MSFNRFYLACVVSLSFTLFSPITEADTLILKNGRTIRCDGAYKEGKVVRYWIGDSEFTLPLDRVERIERDNKSSDSFGKRSAESSKSTSRLTELPESRFLIIEKPFSPESLSAEALNKLEANVKAEPKDIEQRKKLVGALSTTAYLEYQAGNYSQVRILLERALKWDDKNAIILSALAGIKISDGRYSDALNYASRAVKIDPQNYTAYYRMGVAYYALEKIPEAIQSWRDALKIKDDPNIRKAIEKAERELAVARNFTTSKSRFFNISIEGKTLSPTLESSIFTLLEDSYKELKRRFSYEPSEKISAIFYTQETFFNVTKAPSWAGALNDGKLRIPVGGLNGNTDELAKTVMHELAHSFVYFKARGTCPTWLNEGLAQIMEGKSSSIYRSRIAQLATKGTLPSLQSLSGSFRELSSEQAEIAYAYSLTATELLIGRDLRSAMQVLDDLGQNYNISAALSRHTRYRDLSVFEQDLRQRIME